MITMKGKLITLEPLDVEKHAQGYFELSQDENIHKFMGNAVPKHVDEVVQLLKKYEKYFINWVIISNETLAVIGILRLGKPEMENGVLVAGESQILSSAYWRKGHMKEAKKLFYSYVFGELCVEMLYADVWAENENSIKSLEYYGYKLMEVRNEVFSKTGKRSEKYIYSLSKKDYYRRNPCRAASIPHWKAVRIAVPENMKILHEDAFNAEMLEQYVDEPYFRLKHDLRAIEPVVVPRGYSQCQGTVEEFAAHIHECYGNGMTAAEVGSFTERGVYSPELWIALRDNKTGRIVASGIAELDREIGEGILEWIQVSAEYRGRGLGSFIVQELLRRMKYNADFATVSGQCNNPTNPEALYRKCGFTGNDVWHVMRKR